MSESRRRALLAIGIALAAATSLAARALAADTAFETPSQVPAARYLTPAQMSGADWTVDENAVNDGFGNTYTVRSRFGEWKAHGTLMVGVRIREAQALAELDRTSKTEVFADAVKRSAVGQIETVASFATQPVETVKAIPGGVKRWFQKTSYRVSETYKDVKEKQQESDSGTGEAEGDESKDKAKQAAQKKALDYLNVSSAERRWYAQLGVDPYTDNETLRKAIKSYSRIEGLTSFGMKFVGLPSIPGIGGLRKTMDLVWKTDPWELRRMNRKALLGAGLSEETARAFEDNPALSLTMQTGLVSTLQALVGVAGREHLIERAIDVETRGDGQALVHSAALLLRFHSAQEPLAAILAGTRLPVARTQSGALVAFLPTDALFWTAEIADAANGFAATYAAEKATERQIWVVGEASPRFKDGAARLGWEVRDHWQLSAPEDQTASAPGGGR
jgi:hypothetical protein